MRIQAGNAVHGDDYFYREKLILKAWDLLESGHHLLIAAPRRVGKTSLMYYLKDNAKDNYILTYLITESENNENEFFRRIINKVLKTDFVKRSQKIITTLEKHKPLIKKVGPEGVEFGVNDHHDYKQMLIRILKSSTDEKKLIIMIDEFPETLENIIAADGKNAGIHFLQSNRELRQDSEISQNVQFIYAGSIGLENVVSQLESVSTINDLARLKIPPLSENEAKEMINNLLQNVEFNLTEAIKNSIIQRIEWLIPFYIQLIIQELKYLWQEEDLDEITENYLDKATAQILENRNHFEPWEGRLRQVYKGKDYSFIKDLLNIISDKNQIHTNEIFDLAVKYQKEESYKIFVSSLVYDGYINNHDDKQIYRFNSPILRMWWRQNVAN